MTNSNHAQHVKTTSTFRGLSEGLELIGFASGVAANIIDCALGPWYLYYHPELFNTIDVDVHWQSMIQTTATQHGRQALPFVEKNIEELGRTVLPFAKQHKPFCVIGGDHSCAIGTWSAVAHSNRSDGDIGLIWIDAHMDSHTPATSLTQNIHGMPVAHLLGEGIESLCHLFDREPKLKSQNLYVIGIRSYEEDEAKLLTRLGVNLVYMEEVQQRGIEDVLSVACQTLAQTTCGFGISIDLDAIDPLDAPGVGCPEPNGIRGGALVSALKTIQYQKPLLGLELAEYNPIRDQDGKTAKLMIDLIHAVYS